jgi:hypothetical protein
MLHLLLARGAVMKAKKESFLNIFVGNVFISPFQHTNNAN